MIRKRAEIVELFLRIMLTRAEQSAALRYCHHHRSVELSLNNSTRVALLSYTSKSKSSKIRLSQKMKAATELTRRKAHDLGIPMEIDGELQVDAALDAVAMWQNKKIESPVMPGRPMYCIFPNLHASNIASKFIDYLTRARTYSILTGLSRPAAEISRGANASDIFLVRLQGWWLHRQLSISFSIPLMAEAPARVVKFTALRFIRYTHIK